MIGKILAIFVIAIVAASVYVIYENFPGEPIRMKTNVTTDIYYPDIKYGATPVFKHNLRFNHTDISYYIRDECSKDRRKDMRDAFRIFEEQMPIIHFYPSSREGSADIVVGCSDDFIKVGEGYFAAGEGGPSVILNGSKFKVIVKGKISLYRKNKCDYPVVALHELCHVFGFDHINNPQSIMYNFSNCNQRLTKDMVDLINQLYSIEALPDAKIYGVSAIKKGRYLDFNITVMNDGLLEIQNIGLSVEGDGENIKDFSLGKIGIGSRKNLYVTNLRLPSRGTSKISFIVDKENRVKELDESNNFAVVSV